MRPALLVSSAALVLAAASAPAAGQIERAEQARRRGDLATARRLYDQALAVNPEDTRAAVGLAEMLHWTSSRRS